MFRCTLVGFLLCCASQANAEDPAAVQGQYAITAGLRVSYQRDLGFGLGLHGSYWTPVTQPPLVSATAGLAWYQRGTLQYVGMQTGLGFFGAGSGLFAQQGPSGSLTGIYYDGWISYVAGFSVRKFKPWGADFGATPADLSIFGFYPLKIDTKGEALF